MSLTLATWVVRLAGMYLGLGALFAIPFAWRLVGRIDPVARHGTTGFRLLILPGSVALWPLLLTRLIRRRDMPPEERNAHRERAR